MLTIGQKLENGIESLLSLSSEIADLQSQYGDALKDLSMYNSLIEIQKYLGFGSDLNELLPSIEDVIVGVFGTFWCKIIIDQNDIHKMPVDTGLSMENLNSLELNEFYLDDKMKMEMFGVSTGKLGILRMHLMDDKFGYIILHWGFSLNLTDNNMKFLELLKSQLEISIINAQLLSKFKNV
jgi:hypothetical protein